MNALELADAIEENADLDSAEGCNPVVCKLEWDAAAELRRLHEQNASIKAANIEYVDYFNQMKEERDALVEALKDLLWYVGQLEVLVYEASDTDDCAEVEKAKSVLAKVGEV